MGTFSSALSYNRALQFIRRRVNTTAMHAAPPFRCKVCIVGAGFAGLSAASTLRQGALTPGLDFVVLEASQNRVGGRAHTLNIHPDLAFEMGATWIHGIGDGNDPNPVFNVAVAAGLMSASPRPQKWWGSRFLLPYRAARLTSHEELVVQKAVDAYTDAVYSLDDTVKGEEPRDTDSLSIGDVLDRAWTEWQQQSEEGHEALAEEAWNWREQLQSAIDGYDDTHDAHEWARAVYSEYGGSEVNAAVPGGYQAVAETLARDLEVKLSHAVDCIQLLPDDSGVLVSCTNGAVFHADVAVVTTSLGVLKARHAGMFQPQLPLPLQTAIQRLKIGVVDKIMLDFAPAKDAITLPSSSSVSPPTNNITADPDAGVVTYAVLQPREGLEGLPEWTRGIFSIRWGGPEFKRQSRSRVRLINDIPNRKTEESVEEEDIAPLGPPVYRQAVIWLTGEAAKAMELAADAEVLAGIKAVIDRFPGVELPVDADWGRVTLVRSKWGQEPNFLGSYSYVGREAKLEDVETLAKGIVKADGAPRILFAGEACHLRYIVSFVCFLRFFSM